MSTELRHYGSILAVAVSSCNACFCIATRALGIPHDFKMVPPFEQLCFLSLRLPTSLGRDKRSLELAIQFSHLSPVFIIVLQFQAVQDFTPVQQVFGWLKVPGLAWHRSGRLRHLLGTHPANSLFLSLSA